MTNQDNLKSDKEVVELVKAGDKEAYAGIVERYQDKLLRYAHTIVRESQAAADVVQNSFIKAYINLNSYNSDYAFSSWIYRIVHNEAINFIKKHKRETVPDDELWFDQIPDSSRPIDDEVDSILLSEQTRNYIEELPLKYREPLILYYYSGHSYTDISDILKIPTATVGTRINRGKKQLKQLITNGKEQT